MARQIYFRGEVAPARVNIPQRLPDIAGATAAMNSRPTQAGELVKSISDAGQKIAGAYIRMQGHIEDAWLEAKQRYSEWQAEYNRSHQAADALDAQNDYQNAWNSIASDVTSRYGEKLEGGYHHLLARKLELGRLYANDDGARYQDAQYKAWGANQEKLQLSNLDQLVRDNPYDADRINMERDEAVRAWRTRNPGQDSTVFERGLETGIASGRISVMMAQKDFAGASAVLEQHRGALDPVKAAEIAEKLAQEQAIQMYEGNPLAGAAELMTKAGREKFGLSRERAASVARQLSALASYQKRAQRAGYAVARRQALVGINGALERGDVVGATRMLDGSPAISPRHKRRMQRIVRDNVPEAGRWDPEYVGSVYARLLQGEEVGDPELDTEQKAWRVNGKTRKFLSEVRDIQKDEVYWPQFQKAAEELERQMDTATYGMPQNEAAFVKANARSMLAGYHRRSKAGKELDALYSDEWLPQVIDRIVRTAVPSVRQSGKALERDAGRTDIRQALAARQAPQKKQDAQEPVPEPAAQPEQTPAAEAPGTTPEPRPEPETGPKPKSSQQQATDKPDPRTGLAARGKKQGELRQQDTLAMDEEFGAFQ